MEPTNEWSQPRVKARGDHVAITYLVCAEMVRLDEMLSGLGRGPERVLVSVDLALWEKQFKPLSNFRLENLVWEHKKYDLVSRRRRYIQTNSELPVKLGQHFSKILESFSQVSKRQRTIFSSKTT